MTNFKFWPRLMLVSLIKFYQRSLSFDHSFLKIFYPHGFCRFTPTCSNYAVEAVSKYGVIKGGFMSAWRILRCNPWNHGGHDPVK